MPRSNIRSTSKDLITDDGSVLISVVQGEQVRIAVTLGWITNLTSHTLTAKVVEGDNSGSGSIPEEARSGGVVTTLPIIDSDATDNEFEVVIPEDLTDTWTQGPTPGKPAYGFFGLQVADPGTGNDQQIWKPMRGLVEVRYSPTEAT